MQLPKVIEQLGYSPSEARVYLAALSLGEAHASDIAANVKLPRSTVQLILEKLHTAGLMNFYVRRRYKTWEAENPEKLLAQLREREESVREAMSKLQGLRRAKEKNVKKPGVRVFVGPEVRFIFEDMIATRRHILGIIPQDQFLRSFEGTHVWELFVKTRVKHFLRIRLLVPDTPAGRKLTEEADKHLREVRFLPEDIGIQSAIFIYGNKVATILFNEKQLTGVILEDPGIYETNSSLFEELWVKSESAHGTGDSPFGTEGFFRAVADALPRPMLITNVNVEIQYVNNAWEKQFGYRLDEVRGKNPRILQGGQTPHDVYARMWRTLKAGKIFKSDEVIDRRKDGSFFNLYTTTFPVRSGGELYYVQVLDDVTDAKRIDEFRKHFVRIAAHDIRNPLQSIKLMSELAHQTGQSEENARDIQEEIARMDRLTKLLLDVSLFDRGEMQLSVQHFDIAELIRGVVDSKHAYRGEVIFENPRPLLVNADPGRIEQVLINLIENALKHSATKAPVTVALSKEGNRAIISVRDKGRGIPKREIPKLFDAFFRTQATSRSSVAGSGLGLYIVKEIIKAHKGRIWVESKEGKGSTFSFSLPIPREVRRG